MSQCSSFPSPLLPICLPQALQGTSLAGFLSEVISKAAAAAPGSWDTWTISRAASVIYNFRPGLFLVNNWRNKCLSRASLSSVPPQINSTKICWPVTKLQTEEERKLQSR